MKYTSIIIASFIPSQLRLKMFYSSMESLINTTRKLPVEIIVVDNGGIVDSLSDELLSLSRSGKIQCYIKNATNMHFGFARNQGLAMAKGDYICIADNDIYYENGWLEACADVLEAYPKKKIYATPVEYPTGFLKERYDRGKLKVGDSEYNLNMRAGSNCFVIRRKDMDTIGNFEHHRIAGSKWTDKAVRLGYLAAVAPGQLIKDLGLRNGYNLNEPLPIYRKLCNGERRYFNTDEFKIPNN